MRRIITGLVAAGAIVTLVGCSSGGSSSESPSPSATASVAPEDLRAPAAEVALGLKALDELTAQIAAAPDAAGKALSEGIEPIWMPIEGTIKANDPDAYLTFEDAFALLESGDQAKAKKGADAVASASKAYLAKYPG